MILLKDVPISSAADRSGKTMHMYTLFQKKLQARTWPNSAFATSYKSNYNLQRKKKTQDETHSEMPAAADPLLTLRCSSVRSCLMTRKKVSRIGYYDHYFS